MSSPKFQRSKGEIKVGQVEGTRVNRKSFLPKNGKTDKVDKPEKTHNHAFNDESWYNKYPVLADIAGTLAFNHIGGTPYVNALGAIGSQNGTGTVDEVSAMKIAYITTPGVCNGETSALVMQFRKLYLALRRKYRGLNTYQVGDLAVTIFCVCEFYRYIAKLERIYGICKYYSVMNRTMPRVIPAVLSFDYSDVISHLADFRYGINALIVRAKSLCLPAGIDILNRWFLLESNIFKDSDTERAAYIAFDDANMFYTYQSGVYSTGGSAVLTEFDNNWTTNTVQELLNGGADMLGLLLQDEDITLIMSDLTAAFSENDGRLMFLQELPEDYVVVPTYNPDILEQIHNMNMVYNKIATPSAVAFDNTYWDTGAHNTFSAFVGVPSTVVSLSQDALGQPNYELQIGNSADSDNGVFFNQSATLAFNTLHTKIGPVLLDTWRDKASMKACASRKAA